MWYYELVKISTVLSPSTSLSDVNRGLHTSWPVSLLPTGALNTSGPGHNANYYSLCCLLSLFPILSILSFHFCVPCFASLSLCFSFLLSCPVAFPGWQWWITRWLRWFVMPYPTPEYTMSHLLSLSLSSLPFFSWVSPHFKVSRIQWG